MRQATTIITVDTHGQGLTEITRPVTAWVREQGMDEGLLTLFCRHTSASLIIQENAAPEVKTDILDYFARIAPEDARAYAHDDEGPDDMPAHLRSILTGVQLSIPLIGGRLMLGTWQGIWLGEHRIHGGARRIVATLQGE